MLVVAGDDHGCVSSSMPHQSDHAFMAWRMPVMQPASVAEYLEFGLYGYELSRYSGAWKAYEKTLVDMKDMADMVRKSQVDAVASLTNRATENTQEIKKLLQPPAAPKK